MGTVFPWGLSRIVFCDVCPNPDRTMLRFEQTKKHSLLLCYYKGDWSHFQIVSFRGTVTSEGLHLDLNVGAIHLTFPPDAVAEPTNIMIDRWKYEACSPQLTEHEAVVSTVVEISAASEVTGLKFNGEFKT